MDHKNRAMIFPYGEVFFGSGACFQISSTLHPIFMNDGYCGYQSYATYLNLMDNQEKLFEMDCYIVGV
jgi:hypothetical protein